MTNPEVIYRTIEEIKLLVAEAGLISAKEAGDAKKMQVWTDRIHEHQQNLKDETAFPKL